MDHRPFECLDLIPGPSERSVLVLECAPTSKRCQSGILPQRRQAELRTTYPELGAAIVARRSATSRIHAELSMPPRKSRITRSCASYGRILEDQTTHKRST